MKELLKYFREIIKKQFSKYMPFKFKQNVYEILTHNKLLSRLANVPFNEVDVFLKKRWNNHLKNVKKTQKNNLKTIQKLKKQNKIKVCFSLVYDSSFALESLFQKMRSDSLFEPFILIIPDAYRGEENMFYQMQKTYLKLKNKYGENFVFKSYNEQNKTWWDYTDCCDIVVPANPYDDMTLPLYGIHYAAQKNKLIIYQSYGFENVKWSNYHAIHLREMHLCWKIYAENKQVFQMYLNAPTQAKNVILCGYAKMDLLAKVELREREREREQKPCQQPLLLRRITPLAWNTTTFCTFPIF